MTDQVQIQGGAGEFEAAALAAVVSYVLESEKVAMRRRPDPPNHPPAWVRAGWARDPDDPLDVIAPEHRGDPL